MYTINNSIDNMLIDDEIASKNMMTISSQYTI